MLGCKTAPFSEIQGRERCIFNGQAGKTAKNAVTTELSEPDC
jgi:hypothetical protein